MRAKGQAALEFITTYGWAILVILMMIGAISYFGIMRPSKILPERCIVSSEMACADHQILDNTPNPSTVSLRFQQAVGKTIYLDSLICRYGTQTSTATMRIVGGGVISAGAAWSPRETVEFVCTLSALNGLRGEKAKVPFEIVYRQSAGGFQHTATGDVYAEVQ